MRVMIVGTGYVGLTTGACFAFLGHEVVCQDIDRQRIELLNRGRLPFFEPHLKTLVHDQVQADRLRFVTELSPWIDDVDLIFICVATPSSNGSGTVDLTYVRQAAAAIGRALEPGALRVVVNKSTVPVGSNGFVGKLVREALGAERRGAVHFATAGNPEFLREGSAVSDALFPDRIVIGAEDQVAVEVLHAFYRPLIEQRFAPPPGLERPPDLKRVPFVVTDSVSTEVIKYAANSFLAVKISFINEIANICERVGADIREVARGIGLDQRIGPLFLNAGLGWGGSCFGKDVRGLIADALAYGYEPALLKAALDLNYRQRQACVRKLQEVLKVIRGQTIAVWGLAFKPGTDDLRDAPAVEVVARLLEMGALVRVYDPMAVPAFKTAYPSWPVACTGDKHAAVEGADALVLVTEWPQFRDVDWDLLRTRMRRPVLIDARNYWDKEKVEGLGFVYRGIGIPSSSS